MQRIDFIRQLLGSVVVIGSGQKVMAVAKPVRPHRIYRHILHGTAYYQAAAVAPMLTPGDLLTMKREPQNPYDRNAVAVYFQEYKLGYMPRKDNRIFSRLLERHPERYRAEINEVIIYENDFVQIEMEIFEIG